MKLAPEFVIFVAQISALASLQNKYLLATLLAAVATVIDLLLEPFLDGAGQYMFLYLAVALTSALGGLKAGLFATVLGGAAKFQLFVLEPGTSDSVNAPKYYVLIFLHSLACLTISALAERGLRQQRKAEAEAMLLRAAFDQSPLAAVLLDLNLRIIRVNDDFCQMLGRRSEELTNAYFPALGCSDNDSDAAVTEGLTNGRLERLEYERRYIRKDGQTVWARLFISPARDSNGRPNCLLVKIEDVTSRRQTEEILKRTKQRLSIALLGARGGAWEWNLLTGEMWWSAEMYDLLGVDLDKNINPEFWFDLVHSDDRTPLRYAISKAIEKKKSFEYEFRVKHPERGELWMASYGQINYECGHPAGIAGITVEITGRKTVELQLAATRERIRRQFEMFDSTLAWIKDFVYIVDLNGRLVYGNKALLTELGLEPHQATGKSMLQLNIPKEVEAQLTRDLQRTIATGLPAKSTTSHIGRSGMGGHHENVLTPVFDENKNLLFIAGISRDVTERKQNEKTLRGSEERFRTLVEQAMDGIFLSDSSGRYSEANSAGCRMLGYSREELLKLGMAGIIAPADAPRLNGELDKLQDGKTVCSEWLFRRKDGSAFPGEISGHKLRDGRLQFILRDTTERKKAEQERSHFEERIRQTQKLEALGLLAAGIAHDFNNLLAALFGFIEVAGLQNRSGQNDKVENSLMSAMHCFERAKSITNQLLTFSEGGAPLAKTISIAPVLSTAVKFALSGSAIAADVEIEEALSPCHVDEDQLSQALNCLLMNAREAMPSGGRIFIKARNLKAREPLPENINAGPYVVLAIKDQGKGIPEEALRNIFDPFFSTKEAGRGLGLSIAYSIIKKHHGSIDVETALGEGTTFKIFLPAAPSSQADKEQSNQANAAVKASEHRNKGIQVSAEI